MNFVKVSNKWAILELEDAGVSAHKEIFEEIKQLITLDFKFFIFDFKKVNRFTSNILGFVLGTARILIKECERKVYIKNLSEEGQDMLRRSLELNEAQLITNIINTDGLKELIIT